MLRLVPPPTDEERRLLELDEIRTTKARIRVAILDRDPAIRSAIEVADEALERGHGEREALLMLTSALRT